MIGKPEHSSTGLVTICIATYRRPAGLAALLASLDRIDAADPPVEIHIIVVDNDPQSPASGSLGDVVSLSRWPLQYAFEPTVGVSAARNRLLSLVPAHATFVAFLDDDEVVEQGWLRAMLATQRRTDADAVQGPVQPVFEGTPPIWVSDSDLFQLGPFEDGAPLRFAATNNVLVRKSFLDQHALRFDMRFNLTGGEDEELFSKIPCSRREDCCLFRCAGPGQHTGI